MRVRLSLAVLMLTLGLCTAPAHAQADYAREARWAEEIAPAVLDGDAVMLALPAGRKFLSIYQNVTAASTGVVVVHGLGVHPDWPIINRLRTGLAEAGYATLSVQMPVLAADVRGDAYRAVFPEAAERLRVAVEFLRSRGMKRVAIVSHSLGARMSDHALTAAKLPGIDAWVAVGLSGRYGTPRRNDVPVLDIFGTKDLPAVLGERDARAQHISAIRGSAQMEVQGADHFFEGQEAELVRLVKLFLDQKVGGAARR